MIGGQSVRWFRWCKYLRHSFNSQKKRRASWQVPSFDVLWEYRSVGIAPLVIAALFGDFLLTVTIRVAHELWVSGVVAVVVLGDLFSTGGSQL